MRESVQAAARASSLESRTKLLRPILRSAINQLHIPFAKRHLNSLRRLRHFG
ncbi:MAG: hypothetical protein IRZ28_16175 [Steroidobacteraceae bacterium]|nr:hypothetical protein [Steroidobacteraceae bacterium]